MSRLAAPVLLWAALFLFPLVAVLGEGSARAGEELEELRELHREGEIQSLEAVLKRARERVPEGRLVEAELHREEGRLLYEVEILDGDGVLHELFFDARTGEWLPDWEEEEEP